MELDRKKWIAGVIIVVFLLLITIPYLVAQSASNEARVFGGFLLNPVDGNSYLAKMRQGYEGSWLFTLPFSAFPGDGAALNLYYLFLGHLSRWIGWPLILVFHTARILGALLLSLAVFRFFKRVFPEPSTRLFALGLALFGSGLGWFAAAFGLFTSDFWLAEAYPFLASFANAHFPLGLALQVWLITPIGNQRQFGWIQAAGMVAAGVLLSVVYPFGWVVAAAVSGMWAAWLAWNKEAWKAEIWRWLCLIAGGAPYVAFSLWAVNTHPVLAQWNAQNVTPAPGILDLVISLSPALLLALLGTAAVLREKGTVEVRVLALWATVGVVILYLPISLQRRLISGLFIPGAGLAVFAWQQIGSFSWRRFTAVLILFFSLPTNLLIIMGGIQAARQQGPAIFVYRDELAAFDWLEENTAPTSLVMAAPETGLLIPAYSLMRVLYGHPFETIDAGERLGQVYAFYSGGLDEEAITDLLSAAGVDYIFYGPRERGLGPHPNPNGWEAVFTQGEVQIWAPVE